ncbi:hypothetical protein [Streptomyces fragilis]|uniref:Lipoprotein n=2 Tax=Streptomyces fragilis TaxID=67301 RepID=A0ABV2YF41_9ACTN|nr:hypothetical protein [Streptomyces fragilis]
MMLKKITRLHAGAALLSALSLALVTGCSEGGSAAKSGSDAAGGSGPAAKPLTETELKALHLTNDEVEKGFKVKKAPAAPGDREDVKSTDPKCLAIAQTVSGFAPGSPAAETLSNVVEDKEAPESMEGMEPEEWKDAFDDSMDMDMVIVSLASYEGEGAQEGVAAASASAKDCAGGFDMKFDGAQKVNKVVEEKASGKGDESVAYAVTVAAEEGEATVHVEVVRQGNVVATFYGSNLARLVDNKPYDIPSHVIDAQAAKLA